MLACCAESVHSGRVAVARSDGAVLSYDLSTGKPASQVPPAVTRTHQECCKISSGDHTDASLQSSQLSRRVGWVPCYRYLSR